jgi:ribonuclease E
MSASDDGSYASRFLVKFLEIIAAGLATAVSGYLIAHLSGALSSPTPGPATTVRATTTGSVASSQPAEPIPPVSTDGGEKRVAPEQEPDAAHATQPVHKAVNAVKAEPPRKRLDNAASATENAHNQRSLVARVRAALANLDANRTDSAGAPLHQGSVAPPAPAAQPAPISNPPNASSPGTAPPLAPEIRVAPIQEAPAEPDSPAAAELTPPPFAGAQSPAAPSDAKETGVLSTLEQMLRQDPLAGSDEAPRPPKPVGE